MTMILVHRLELAERVDLALDGDMLDWLADHVGMGRSDIWLRHARGMVGDLSGAERLVDDLFPGAYWAVGKAKDRTDAAEAHAVLIPVGAASPIVSSARWPANALIAATVRAYAASALSVPFAANDRWRAA